MYKYVFNEGPNITVKTPKIESISEIKYTAHQTSECIKSRFEYPSGLTLDIEQYCNKSVWITNKKIILLENGELGFED